MKFLKSSVLFISMACIVPVCSIAREKSERITRAEIEQKSADEFINGLMSRMTVDEKIGQLNLPSYGNVMPNPKKSCGKRRKEQKQNALESVKWKTKR